jgi:DnaJ-class molecular chaperone
MNSFRNSQRWLCHRSPFQRFPKLCPQNHPTILATSSEQKVGWFSNSGNSNIRYPSIQGENPFDILGIPKNSSYEGVKRKFVELAMKTHPDISSKREDGKEAGSVEDFIRLRQAFEAIHKNSDGTARLVDDGEDSSWSDDNFKAWFYEETGHQDVMFAMDLATRKEVMDIAESQSQGGLDKGGMWEMARNMAEQEKSLKNQKQNFTKTSVGVEAGAGGQGTNNGPRRRKRRT